jgi:guanylate kinase
LDELGALDLFDYIVINRQIARSVERLSAIIRAERAS